jgi:hypothetical protein
MHTTIMYHSLQPFVLWATVYHIIRGHPFMTSYGEGVGVNQWLSIGRGSDLCERPQWQPVGHQLAMSSTIQMHSTAIVHMDN